MTVENALNKIASDVINLRIDTEKFYPRLRIDKFYDLISEAQYRNVDTVLGGFRNFTFDHAENDSLDDVSSDELDSFIAQFQVNNGGKDGN